MECINDTLGTTLPMTTHIWENFPFFEPAEKERLLATSFWGRIDAVIYGLATIILAAATLVLVPYMAWKAQTLDGTHLIWTSKKAIALDCATATLLHIGCSAGKLVLCILGIIHPAFALKEKS